MVNKYKFIEILKYNNRFMAIVITNIFWNKQVYKKMQGIIDKLRDEKLTFFKNFY